MRISIVEGDDGFIEFKDRYYRVRLNGRAVPDAVTADSDLGYILQYKRDRKGEVMYKNGEPDLKKRTGEVKIKWVGRSRG